jgi:hypothetical protein
MISSGKGGLDIRQKGSVAIDSLEAVLGGKMGDDAIEIAQRPAHVRRFDLDIMKMRRQIAHHVARVCGLANHLRMFGGISRHIDDKIAAEPGLAAEPPSFRDRPSGRMALLGFRFW